MNEPVNIGPMRRPYPNHIYDPQRRRIAAEVIQHEFRKLFPAVPKKLWPQLDRDIAGWFDGDGYELAPVHDFWNMADGIMRGLKLKALIRPITAENVTWELISVPVADINITWTWPILEKRFGRPPYDTRHIQEVLTGDPEYRKELIANSDHHAATSQPRDHYPVILFPLDGRWGIDDGNRRVLRALLYNHETIKAWVGRRPEGERPRNYWISTAFIQQLGQQATEAKRADDREVLASCRKLATFLFNQSDIARINFELRIKDAHPELAPGSP